MVDKLIPVSKTQERDLPLEWLGYPCTSGLCGSKGIHSGSGCPLALKDFHGSSSIFASNTLGGVFA